MTTSSPKYFASVHDPSGTGLAQDRSLPERIWSSVLAYIEDVLYFSTASLPSRLNFRATDEKVKRETNTAIEQNYDSIVTLVELVLFVATLGETRYHYLDGIDRLEKAVLEELLESIQRVSCSCNDIADCRSTLTRETNGRQLTDETSTRIKLHSPRRLLYQNR